MKCVCGLRWMCCRGGEPCDVECTNAVKKWWGSDCDNQDFQVHWGWVFKLLQTHSTVRLMCKQIWERRRLSRFPKNVYSLRSPAPLIDTDKCYLTPPPCHPSAYLFVFHVFEVSALTISTEVEVETRWLSVVWKGCACGCVPGYMCGVWVWGQMWGLEWRVVGCGYEWVGCGWVGGGGVVVWGGRRERWLVGESASLLHHAQRGDWLESPLDFYIMPIYTMIYICEDCFYYYLKKKEIM